MPCDDRERIQFVSCVYLINANASLHIGQVLLVVVIVKNCVSQEYLCEIDLGNCATSARERIELNLEHFALKIIVEAVMTMIHSVQKHRHLRFKILVR